MNLWWWRIRSAGLHVVIWLMATFPLILMGAAGAAFLATPVRDDPSASGWFAVIRASALQPSAPPQRLPVLQPSRDAWTWRPGRVLGHIFVHCRADGTLLALRADHDFRFRIPVVYDEQKKIFRSTCWNLSFNLEGKERERAIGSDLERLETRVRGGELFVRYGPPQDPWFRDR